MLEIGEALDLTRTGDLWLFRGHTAADRVIRTLTNAPVNHVGMAIVVEDLPPLLLHAELSSKQVDVWSGTHHRGVQLHDLGQALHRWRNLYAQEVYLRQLSPEAGRDQENAALQAVARLDGVSFPSTAKAVGSWLAGRDSWVPHRRRGERIRPDDAFCSETVALTLQEMGVVGADRKANWFDPGTFWSGAYLPLVNGWTYGDEVAVGAPRNPDQPVPSSSDRWR